MRVPPPSLTHPVKDTAEQGFVAEEWRIENEETNHKRKYPNKKGA
jgi:hypothetical protein